MRSSSIAIAALLSAMSAMAATSTQSKGIEEPSSPPMLNTAVVQGCYSSAGELKYHSSEMFNSKSKCATDICFKLGKAVAGTMGGNQCFCGDKYPPKKALANDTDCNIGCTGFDIQACEYQRD